MYSFAYCLGSSSSNFDHDLVTQSAVRGVVVTKSISGEDPGKPSHQDLDPTISKVG